MIVYLLLYQIPPQCSTHDGVLIGPNPEPPSIKCQDYSDHRDLGMADIITAQDGEHHEPESQLSMKDLAVFLMKYTNDAIKEERDHTNNKIREEREHTNVLIKRVIQALSDSVTSLNTSRRVNESRIDELDLKVETVSTYYQELLFNLKSGLLTTFQLVQKDMHEVWSRLQTLQDSPHPHCSLCGEESVSIEKLVEHVVTQHSHEASLPSTHKSISRPADIESQEDIEQATYTMTNPESLVPNCSFCDLSFSSHQALESHLNCYHSSIPPSSLEEHQASQDCHLACHICSQVFSHTNNLTEHFEMVHGKRTPVVCNLCGHFFESAENLETHMLEYHTNPELSCKTCDYNSYNEQDEDTPNEPNHEDVCIPQYDGNDTLDSSVLSPIAQYDGLGDTEIARTGIQSSSSTLHVPYQLNQEKQVKKLVRDANIADFEMHSNDSDRNVSIQCSVGYYGAVVIPAISSISSGFSQIVQGISIKCTSVRKAQDKNSSTPGLFLRFEISGPDIHPSPAPLSVHLHNTQRKVQLQGGAVMPDASRVPVWFAKNMLQDLFNSQARSQNHQIQEINRLVTNVASKEPSSLSCYHCKKRFSTNSRPVQCARCSQFRHATKCSTCPAFAQVLGTQSNLPGVTVTNIPAVSMTSTSTSLASTPVLSMSSAPAIPAGSSVSAVLNQHSPVSVIPATSPSIPSSVSLAIANSQQIVLQHPPPCPDTRPSSRLDPNTPSFLPNPGPSSSMSSIPQGNGAKTKDKNNRVKQKDGITIDYDKIELNTVRTRLKVLETKNKDLEFQNKLLLDRIALFEQSEKEAIYEKYFPKSDSVPAREQHPSPSPPVCQGIQRCCMVRPVCCHLHDNAGPGASSRTTAERSLDLVLKSISELKVDIDDLKARFTNIEALTPTLHKMRDQDQSPTCSINEPFEIITANAVHGGKNKESDDSIVTVDMNVHELSDEEEDPLNSTSLTSRLQKLRQ